MFWWIGLGVCGYFLVIYLLAKLEDLQAWKSSWSWNPVLWIWDNADNDHAGKRKKINLDSAQIAKDIYDYMQGKEEFMWGTATAAHQIEGNCVNNNWAKWENQVLENNKPTIYHNEKSGLACDHWNRVDEDTKLMKDIGCNAYRFSVEWSKIEPEKGKIDKQAVQHYHQEIDALIRNNIIPMITLHHFSHPIWFEDLGAFEKEENIAHFVEFSELVFKEFGSKVKYWCTINEPEVFAVGAYLSGTFPPGKKDPKLVGMVLRNLLIAHVRVFKKIKSLKGGDKSQIGIVKDTFQFHPWSKWNPFDFLLSKLLNHVMNSSILNFLSTGEFLFKFPGASLSYSDPGAPSCQDFVGLNYYSHYYVQFTPSTLVNLRSRMTDLITDMPYAVYAEGLHSALHQTAALKKPIIITECGVADEDDSIRKLFIKRYMYAVSKAMKEGVDIRGFFYWSLMDNFEWAEGYSMKFGLYEMNSTDRKRVLRSGAGPFLEIIKEYNLLSSKNK
jgi:beta-glucosidase